jgi:NADH:ubiquinone oxidoreductase subunit K
MLNYYAFIILASIVFAIGAYGLLSKRNVLRMLLSAEVIFNSVLLFLLTFSTLTSSPSTGGVIAIIAIGIAATEVGVIVSLAVLMFRLKDTIDVYEISEQKG